MNPIIIAVAITGSVPRKRDNLAVPITPAEQIESTHEAHEAGASLVHIHVRNDDESPSSDPERFAAVKAGVEKQCPGHDHPVLDRGAWPGSVPARQLPIPPTRYGVTVDRLC
jgi:uncharacterized protein (DUF849 family)